MDPGLWADDYTHPVSGDAALHVNGPGWDWLETGIAAILGEHPFVSSFYSSYLPIAYAAKDQTGHHRHRQLEVYVGWRGRAEAYLERDRVILKGQVRWWGNIEPQTAIFKWPADWPLPPHVSALYIAHTDTGGFVPLRWDSNPAQRNISAFGNWATATDPGAMTVVLDGVVIPIPAITGPMPDG